MKDNKKEIMEEDKVEDFLMRLEYKLKETSIIGKILAVIPMIISCIRSYIKKEYKRIPVCTIIAIISCLIYVLIPSKLIPDLVPNFKYILAGAIIGVSSGMIYFDLEEYVEWRDKKRFKR